MRGCREEREEEEEGWKEGHAAGILRAGERENTDQGEREGDNHHPSNQPRKERSQRGGGGGCAERRGSRSRTGRLTVGP